ILLEESAYSEGVGLLKQLVDRYPNAPVSVDARVRLARRASEASDWNHVERWCDEAIQFRCDESLLPHVHTLRGQARFERGDLKNSQSDFIIALNHPKLAEDLSIATRFHLAETLYLQEKWHEAEPHWKWLLSHAASASSTASNSDAWVPVVRLRTAEMLALKKEWEQAEKMVLGIRNDFPECNKRAEVDYLYARCLVSRADFETARGVLSTLTREGKPSHELQARAYWMAGETFMLQRNHSDALTAYKKVLDVPKQNYWHSAALLQIGQCCEALSDPAGARIAYEQITNDFKDSPFLATAQGRLSKLPKPPLANQVEIRTGIGPKR
ncbi:MAG: tetratricopeptide repeat protein, partial [Pirellula sp.]